METSILIARILSVAYLAVGLGLLFNPIHYKEVFEKLIHNTTYRFLGAWVAAFLGVIMVQYHNIWVNDWRSIITVVAWIALIKGVLLIIFPRFINDFEFWFRSRRQLNLTTMLVLGLGLLFGWFGFYG
ncbi:MAG: hypothetical protein ABJG78_10915 [Cyclobacteriaceae bacterium]